MAIALPGADRGIITESQLKHVKMAMNTKALLQQVQYIVDAEGNQTAVQMDLELWSLLYPGSSLSTILAKQHN
ncbi:MAG: hypothetical protein GDA38_18690 [Hormoscilla sp. SP12CHS1]|nr:hypothetical protein [Hormoscilla sp. SP12CHS1]